MEKMCRRIRVSSPNGRNRWALVNCADLLSTFPRFCWITSYHQASVRPAMCGIFFSLYADASGVDIEDEDLERERFDSICENLRQFNAERGTKRS